MPSCFHQYWNHINDMGELTPLRQEVQTASIGSSSPANEPAGKKAVIAVAIKTRKDRNRFSIPEVFGRIDLHSSRPPCLLAVRQWYLLLGISFVLIIRINYWFGYLNASFRETSLPCHCYKWLPGLCFTWGCLIQSSTHVRSTTFYAACSPDSRPEPVWNARLPGSSRINTFIDLLRFSRHVKCHLVTFVTVTSLTKIYRRHESAVEHSWTDLRL